MYDLMIRRPEFEAPLRGQDPNDGTVGAFDSYEGLLENTSYKMGVEIKNRTGSECRWRRRRRAS
jgi:hypothetical protein